MNIAIFKNQGFQSCFKEAANDMYHCFKPIVLNMWPACLVFAILLSITEFLRLPNLALHNWGNSNPMTAFSLQTVVYTLTVISLFLPVVPFAKMIGVKLSPRNAGHTICLGFRHFGESLLFAILAAIMICVAMLLVSVPAIILATAQSMAQMGALEGDPVGTPAYFTPLLVVLLIVTNMIFAICTVYAALVFAKLVGSYHIQDKEKKQMSESNKNNLQTMPYKD